MQFECGPACQYNLEAILGLGLIYGCIAAVAIIAIIIVKGRDA